MEKYIFNLLLTLFLFVHFNLFAQSLQIGIITDIHLQSIVISPLYGNYIIMADGKTIDDADPTSIYQLNFIDDSIRIRTLENIIGKFSTISFISQNLSNENSLKIKIANPNGKIRHYDDNLKISVNNGELKVINEIDIEKYTSGVVQAESGFSASEEYYKLQAILCRTYALNNLRRHESEGFELCDLVHCQVYRGRTVKEIILDAVINTKGLVIVDANLNLISAVFHSNCGGQTINSEDLWSLPTSYLKSINDTFCIHQPNARWKRTIPLSDWSNYISIKNKNVINDSMSLFSTFNQEKARCIYYVDRDVKIPLKTIRTDWHLKSTFFTIEKENDLVIINGRGFGHGVGLCQEGAMQMALLGKSYKDIIQYYFRDVQIVDINKIDFFRDE